MVNVIFSIIAVANFVCMSICSFVRSHFGSMAERSRFAGSPEEYAAIWRPFVAKHGRGFLQYDEASKVADAKTNLKLILKASALVAAVKSRQENLSLVRSKVKASLAIIREEYTWNLNADDARDWEDTMTARLMNLCYAVRQAELKKNPPAWLDQMPWNVEKAPAERKEQDLPQNDPDRWIFGYNTSARQAWRVPVAKPKAKQEYSLRVHCPAGAPDTCEPLAEWADGLTNPICELTCGDVRNWDKGLSPGNTFEVEHTVTRSPYM